MEQDKIASLDGEEWRDIPGYEGKYRICNIGNKIESYGGTKKYSIMKLFDNGGYLRIGLSKNGIRKKYLLHRLKAITFIPNPDNKSDINHIDGNKMNNELSNLEWCTRGENIRHAHRLGLMKNNHYLKNHPDKGKFGKNHNRAKIVFQMSKQGKIIKKWYSISDAKRTLKIKGIYNALAGYQPSAGGFVWMYPRDLLAALMMVRERELRKKEMQTLDDYIKVIKEIDSAIVSELTSLLP